MREGKGRKGKKEKEKVSDGRMEWGKEEGEGGKSGLGEVRRRRMEDEKKGRESKREGREKEREEGEKERGGGREKKGEDSMKRKRGEMRGRD